MKKVITLLIFLFQLIIVIGQNKNITLITDTSIIIGMINEDVNGGRLVSENCINGKEKQFTKGTVVLISGVKSCSNMLTKNKDNFYEIIYKRETYFIEKEKLETIHDPFPQIEKMSKAMADSFRNHAQNIANKLFDLEIKDALKFLDFCKTKGLTIIDWFIYDESEYTEGTSIKIKVYNPTQKIIKYLWFTFVGINAVDDKVTDRTRGKNITMKGIGPINPEENGTYDYKYVWFTDIVESAKIISIKIQYMDGSIKVITNPKEITLSKENKELLF